MRLLVTGAGGQLGTDVVLAATRAGHEALGLARASLDITDAAAVSAAVRDLRPTAIVNCAAFTAVDRCETEPEAAQAVNQLGVRHLAAGASETGAHLVQVSTDYVFSGDKAEPYVETDEPDPRSVYGRTKLAGEREVGPGHAIVRTAWLSGAHGPNIVRTILGKAAAGEKLRFVDDQRGQPTFTADLAPLLVQVAAAGEAGLFHATNTGPVTWYEFARAVVEAGGHDPLLVSPIATSELQPARPAPRPANSVLANVELVRRGYPPLRHWSQPLAELVAGLPGT